MEGRPKQTNKHSGYVWTLNNPEGRGRDFGEWTWKVNAGAWPDVAYCVYQLERGENGTLHLQGYLELKNRKRFTELKKFHGLFGAHFEPRKGSPSEARDYCMKTDTRVAGPWEHGVFDPEKGSKKNKTAKKKEKAGEKSYLFFLLLRRHGGEERGVGATHGHPAGVFRSEHVEVVRQVRLPFREKGRAFSLLWQSLHGVRAEGSFSKVFFSLGGAPLFHRQRS